MDLKRRSLLYSEQCRIYFNQYAEKLKLTCSKPPEKLEDLPVDDRLVVQFILVYKETNFFKLIYDPSFKQAFFERLKFYHII